jgi:hypothetical protein
MATPCFKSKRECIAVRIKAYSNSSNLKTFSKSMKLVWLVVACGIWAVATCQQRNFEMAQESFNAKEEINFLGEALMDSVLDWLPASMTESLAEFGKKAASLLWGGDAPTENDKHQPIDGVDEFMLASQLGAVKHARHMGLNRVVCPSDGPIKLKKVLGGQLHKNGHHQRRYNHAVKKRTAVKKAGIRIALEKKSTPDALSTEALAEKVVRKYAGFEAIDLEGMRFID